MAFQTIQRAERELVIGTELLIALGLAGVSLDWLLFGTGTPRRRGRPEPFGGLSALVLEVEGAWETIEAPRFL